jgi:hypothetical protein
MRFHWSLFPDATRVPKDETRYRALALDPSHVTIMLPIAPWAMGSASIFGLDDYYQTLVTRVVDGLQNANAPVDLVFISLFRPQSLTIERRGDVTVHYPGLIEYDSYDHLLCSCDAIVTDNIISTSTSKAVVIGTPHLIIQNMEPSEMPYRYNMFPLKVLFPSDREYARSVEIAEFGNATEIRDKLGAILSAGFHDARARANRLKYLERLRQLANPGNILEQIIGGPKAAGTLAS